MAGQRDRLRYVDINKINNDIHNKNREDENYIYNFCASKSFRKHFVLFILLNIITLMSELS